MPSNNHLPRLKWTGEEAVRFSLGETHLPDTLLRLSLDDSLDTQTGPTLYISDVLSLLTRADGTAPPKASERALQFLSIVCSRLPLADVIEPRHMPAGFTGPSRRRLAWLLSILGVGADSVDLDRLRARAGGHAGVLWTLVETARTTDPIDGVRAMGGAGDDLDEVLVSGIERDLDRDDDLLLLGLGLSSEFLQIGCTRENLAEALVDLWTDSGGLVVSERIRVSESVTRLMEAGYVVEDHGELFSCDCAASRALARRADPAWLASLVDRVDAVESVEGRAFEMILEMIRHQQKAAGAIGNDVSDRAEARRRVQGHLSDRSAFELRDLCRDVVDRLREQHRADIMLDLGESEVWVASCGPRIWVDCMIQELVTNAVAATSELAPGEGTVWLRIAPHREDGRVSLVVGNNGSPMPEEVIAAFRAGRRARDVTRPGRGTGLHTYRVFGERHGVRITLGENGNETEVTCSLPSVRPVARSGTGE
jgi:hypothetical protein